jgi:hypothetical protein
LLKAASGAVAQPGLVIVETGVIGQAHEIEQLVAVEHRQALTRIEDERHAGFGKIAGVLHHAFTAVRRDDTELGPGLFHLVQVRETHCPRMEGGDLVVVQISGDEGLRGKTARYLTHVGAAQAQFVEALQIGAASSPTVAMMVASPPSNIRL